MAYERLAKYDGLKEAPDYRDPPNMEPDAHRLTELPMLGAQGAEASGIGSQHVPNISRSLSLWSSDSQVDASR